MDIQIVHRFHTPAYARYAVHLAKGEPDMLGVLYITTSQDTSTQYDLSLALIDVQKQVCKSLITYSNKGPGMSVMTDALLRYDAPAQRWIIAQLQNDEYIALRTLTMKDINHPTLSPLCLLDKDESDLGINPLLGLEIINETYRFFYSKSAFEHKSAPIINKLDIILHQADWDVLEEASVSITSEGIATHKSFDDDKDIRQQQVITTKQINGQTKKVLLPEQTFFDPGTIYASQTTAVHITSKAEVAEAENALVYTDQLTQFLVLCSPETWVTPQMNSLSQLQQTDEQWRIWLTGWDSNWSMHRWTYSPDLALPVDLNVPAWKSPPSPTIHVTVIAGPSTSSQSVSTLVVALAMVNQDKVLSHAVCLDNDGQVIQTCTSSLGLRPSLCRCEHMIVGVDNFEGSWRLWNWPVLLQNELSTLVPLDATCQRAFVHTVPASTRFWLIEELQSGLRVTCRDASSLAEIVPSASLPGVNLLPDQNEVRPLDGYRDIGIVPYQETLLLLVRDSEGELVLYQVR